MMEEFTLESFLNNLIREADRSEKLPPKQLMELADALKQHDLLGLPDQQGEEPQVNPKFITLSYGDEEFRFALTGGGELPETSQNGRTPSSADRFVSIVEVIMNLLESLPKDGD